MTFRFIGLTNRGRTVTVRVDAIIAFYDVSLVHDQPQTAIILKDTNNIVYVDETRDELLQLITEIMG